MGGETRTEVALKDIKEQLALISNNIGNLEKKIIAQDKKNYRLTTEHE